MKTLLTSDKMPWMVMLFGFPAGIMVLLATVLGFGVYETFQALGNGAPDLGVVCSSSYPPVCVEESRRDRAMESAGVAVLFVLVAGVLWQTGFRYRHVWFEGNEVRVVWGRRLPITLRRYRVADLSKFEIKKEERYAITPRVGTSTSGVQRMPDRWRLTAQHSGRRANLGSYVSDSAATQAVRQMKAAGTS